MKSVLVTGSSSGFGLLITKRLLENGYSVLASMRDVEGKNASSASKIKDFASEQSGSVHIVDLDVTNDSSVDTAIDQILNKVGNVDVVVNNAGIGQGGFTEAFELEQFKKVFEVNVFGVQRVMRAILPSMRSRGSGLIINISSIMGRVVIPYAGIYTASKYALEGLSESYRYELKGTGVDVVVIEPGGFPTSFFGNMMSPADESRVESYGELAEVPQKLWGGFAESLKSQDAPDPNEVAKAVIEVIEMPATDRPTRTVVDPGSGGMAPKTINKTSQQVQDQMMQMLGMNQPESA